MSSTKDGKAVIKNADMSDEMRQFAVDTAAHAISKYTVEKVSTISQPID
jgi:hypothetical protein